MKNKLKTCGFFRFRHRRMLFCPLVFQAIFAGFSEPFFNFAEFKCAPSITIPAGTSEKEKALAGNGGIRLSFRDADARAYLTLQKTEFAAIKECETVSEKADLFDAPRYGAGFFLFRENIPITIKIGHNTYGKSVSKIRNPSPSTTANPLAKSFAFASGSGASLPTMTSSQQPLSLAFSVKKDLECLPFQISFEGFFTEKKEKFLSLSAKFGLPGNISIQPAFSFGEFFLENKSAILKKNNAAFDENSFYSGLGELSISSPVLKINFYSGFQQSPYGTDSWWFKFDGRTSFRAFLLNISYFALPSSKKAPKVAPLIGASSSICRIVEQASINPQILFLFDDKNASSIRLGFSLLENWKVTATNTPVQLNTMKVRTGIEFENRLLNTRFDWTEANILLSGDAPTKSSLPERFHSFSLSTSSSCPYFKYALSGSYSYYPPPADTDSLKESCSFDIKIAFPAMNVDAQAGLDMTFKDGQRYSGEWTISLAHGIKKKYLHTSMKLKLLMPF